MQFGNVAHRYANSDQLDPAVYGQYRKAEFYDKQNVQSNSATQRRSAGDSGMRVNFEDGHGSAVRQSRDKTVMRPRSVNSATHWEKYNQVEQTGHKTARRPRSVTFALPDENAYSALGSQEKDLRTQKAEAPQDSRHSARQPEEGGYSRAGYHQNQSALQNFQRAYNTPQSTANTGDCRGRNASYRTACTTTNQQKARAMQQVMSGYETMKPVDHSRTNKSHASPPEYSEYVAMQRQRALDGVNHSAQNVRQQRTGYPAREDNGYEEMRPQHCYNPAARSAATTEQNLAHSNTAAFQQNAAAYSVAGNQQNPPISNPSSHQYSHATSDSSPTYRNTGAQRSGKYSHTSTQQISPHSTAATQANGAYSHTASSQPNYAYNRSARQPSRPHHAAATTAQESTPYNMAAAQQDVTYSHPTSQQYGAYHPPPTTQQNGAYSHVTNQQNGIYHPAAAMQHYPPYSGAVTQQHGPYGHQTGQQNGTYPAAAAQQVPLYNPMSTQQNGTYAATSYSTATTQQNGTYNHVTSTQNGAYHHAAPLHQSAPYSTTGNQQNGTYSHVTNPQNGSYHPVTTQENGTHSTGMHQSQEGHQSNNENQQENGYDGYDSSDSDFDDTDDDDAYDYVNLRQSPGTKNGAKDSTDACYQQSDR